MEARKKLTFCKKVRSWEELVEYKLIDCTKAKNRKNRKKILKTFRNQEQRKEKKMNVQKKGNDEW